MSGVIVADYLLNGLSVNGLNPEIQEAFSKLMGEKANSFEEIKATVYRLSPLGVELILNKDNATTLTEGDEINLKLQIGASMCEFTGIKVASVQIGEHHTLFGFRWCARDNSYDPSTERRGSSRWMCGEHYLPAGVAPNPARFNDYIYFVVRDISLDGMQLSTSLRNKFLIPGMVLDSTVSFPLIGQVNIKLKIINTRILSSSGKDSLGLGVQLLEKTESINGCLGQYLLQFGSGLTVRDLKASGLKVKSANDAISYSFVKTANDYRDVLKLRYKAYAQVGKADSNSSEESMSDMFDTQSRILMAKHQGRLIGSWRITFHTPDEKNEYDQFVTFPDNFPRRDEVVVLSRLCTDPEYRGSDLFYGLIKQCFIVALQSKRRYILGGCTEALLPLYKKIGLTPWEIFYEHGGLQKVKEQIIVADVVSILTGKNVDLTVWSEMYADLLAYLSQFSEIPTDPLTNLRLSVYKTLGSTSRFFGNIFRK